MIIAIEGGDACGKATQSKLLAERLKGTRFAFPNYETPLGKDILGHLKKEWVALDEAEYGHGGYEGEYNELLNARVFQALQTCNRLEMLSEIEAALARGPVVFDRYTVSALVYGKLDGLDVEWIKRIQAKLPEPDIWILLDVPVEEGFNRRPERRDRIESNRPYLEKVREEYLSLFGFSGGSNAEYYTVHNGWWVVNGLGTVERVAERIYKIVNLPL